LALKKHREGLSIAAIAAIVEATPDEVEEWIAEAPRHEMFDDYYEERARLRGERTCANCGKALPAGGPRTESCGRYFCSVQCANNFRR
jgi:hypothetical protein